MLKKLSIAFSVLIFLSSCKKNVSPVGVDVLPGTDQLGGAYAEILAKTSYSILDDSAFTTNVSNVNLLGSMNDPVFGRTDASIYSNFELKGNLSNIADLGVNPVLDSVVLSLIYNTSVQFIGDTAQTLSIDVFPLQEKMHRDSNYFSKRSLPYSNLSLIDAGQSRTFNPNILKQILINKDDPAPSRAQLRVRLKKEFGEMLFNYNYLSSLSNFQNIFYGLFITTNHSILPQPDYGSIFYVDMNLSTIQLYYHNNAGPQLPLPIICGGNSVRFGHFDHDYQFLAEHDLSHQLAPYSDHTLGNQNIYLQGITGLKARIEFPDLLNWRDSNIIINRAELTLKQDLSQSNYSNTTLFQPPGRLFLQGADPTTGLPATLIENIYAFGGGYDAANFQYSFLIPHTIGGLITGKNNNTTFYASIYNSGLFPQRVVLGGCTNSTYPVKLKLWYTRLTFPKGSRAIKK